MKTTRIIAAALALALLAGHQAEAARTTAYPALPGGLQTGDQLYAVRNGADYTAAYAAPVFALGSATGTLGVTQGGTGLTALGAAGQCIVVNQAATGLTYGACGTTGSYTAGTGLALNTGAFSVVYGTGPSTAAQGNDSRFALAVSALQPANNLSDLASPSAARGNLGLGSAATANAASFLQAGSNLSDLPSAATARTNLGLGSLATQSAVNLASQTTGVIPATSVPTLNQSTTGNAATASALLAAPTGCPAGQFATGVSSNGNATCATPATASSVSSVFGRTGAVTAQSGDYGVGQVTGALPSLNPVMTGTASLNNTGATLQQARPGTALQIASTGSPFNRVEMDALANSASFTLVRTNGTAASPSTLASGDEIGGFNACAYSGTASNNGYQCGIGALAISADGPWSASSTPTKINLLTAPANSTTGVVAASILSTGVAQFNFGTSVAGVLAANGGLTGTTGTFSGSLAAGSLAITGNETVGGTLGVTGASTFSTASVGTLQLPNSTAHGILIGEAGAGVVSAPVGTSGYPLLSGGSGADPAFGLLNLASATTGSLPVLQGGSGATDVTNIVTTQKNYNTQQLQKFNGCVARVLAHVGSCDGLMVGDSTTGGYYAFNGNVGEQVVGGYPYQLAAMLNSAGIPANADGFMGFLGSAQDTQMVVGSDWSINSNTSLGGNMLYASANTGNPYTFQGRNPNDGYVVYYMTQSGNGSIAASINGGTVTTTATSGSTGFGTASISAPYGFNKISVNWSTGGGVYLIGVKPINTTKAQINLVRAGWGGSKSGDWASVYNNFQPGSMVGTFGQYFTVLMLGINDWVNNVALATYTTNMQTVITRAKLAGDVLLMSSTPSSPSGTYTQANQLTYVAAVQQLAVTNGIAYWDIFNQMVSYAAAYAQGFYPANSVGGGLHPLAPGYRQIAYGAYNGLGSPTGYNGASLSVGGLVVANVPVGTSAYVYPSPPANGAYFQGSVGIGTATPATALHVNGDITTAITGSVQCLHVNAAGKITGTGTDCGAASGGTSTLGTSSTTASPQASGDATTGLYSAGAGLVDVAISGVKTFEVGSAGASVSGGLVVGSPTGGNQGSGTVNATAIYVNGVALGGAGAPVSLGTSTSNTNPQISGDATSGLYSDAAATLKMAISGANKLSLSSSALTLATSLSLPATSNVSFGSNVAFTTTGYGIWTIGVPGTPQISATTSGGSVFKFGAGDGTTISNQIITFQSASSGANVAGKDALFFGSKSTGTAVGGGYNFQVTPASGTSSSTQNALATALYISGSGPVGIGTATPMATLDVRGPVKLNGYTVAGLSSISPAASIGDIAYVTDATSCTYGGSLTGGGSTPCKVWYNGTAWIGG